jgi:hypothetical protein
LFLALTKNKIFDHTSKLELLKETHESYLIIFSIVLVIFDSVNVYLFWILFLALWAIVPLMIIKGRVDEEPEIQTAPKVKAKKKGWFN